LPARAGRATSTHQAARAFNHAGPLQPWLDRRDRQKKPGRNGNDTGTPLSIGIRLLPTPDTGTSVNGHGRRGGRPGNGHQSGKGPDAAATPPTPAPQAGTSPAG